MASVRRRARSSMALFDGVQSLDVTGPLEVFARRERLLEATAAPRARL